jgi:hypothetical protein
MISGNIAFRSRRSIQYHPAGEIIVMQFIYLQLYFPIRFFGYRILQQLFGMMDKPEVKSYCYNNKATKDVACYLQYFFAKTCYSQAGFEFRSEFTEIQWAISLPFNQSG